MRSTLLSLSLLAFALLPACKSTGCCTAECAPQTVVDKVAKENPGVTRLTVHCMQDGAAVACASTSAEKKGKPSDPEDLKAMGGETVVLDEAGAVDVTVPILAKDGKFGGACGVTLKLDGMTKEQAVAKAKTIAAAVDAGLGGCCDAGGSCCDTK